MNRPDEHYRYTYIASKVAVVVGILKDEWDSDCSLPNHRFRLCTLDGISLRVTHEYSPKFRRPNLDLVIP